MNANLLRNFLLGRASARDLASDLESTTIRTGRDTFQHQMRDLDEDFIVESSHLVRICDAVLHDELPPALLREIGFGMIASDHFLWDGDTPEGSAVGATLYDWSSPEVNFALTKATVAKFRHRLLTGEDTFTRADYFTGSDTRSHVEYRSSRAGEGSA